MCEVLLFILLAFALRAHAKEQADAKELLPESMPDEYKSEFGRLVWARGHAKWPFWPGVLFNPLALTKTLLQNDLQQVKKGKFVVMYFGMPSSAAFRFVTKNNIKDYDDHKEKLSTQKMEKKYAFHFERGLKDIENVKAKYPTLEDRGKWMYEIEEWRKSLEEEEKMEEKREETMDANAKSNAEEPVEKTAKNPEEKPTENGKEQIEETQQRRKGKGKGRRAKMEEQIEKKVEAKVDDKLQAKPEENMEEKVGIIANKKHEQMESTVISAASGKGQAKEIKEALPAAMEPSNSPHSATSPSLSTSLPYALAPTMPPSFPPPEFSPSLSPPLSVSPPAALPPMHPSNFPVPVTFPPPLSGQTGSPYDARPPPFGNGHHRWPFWPGTLFNPLILRSRLREISMQEGAFEEAGTARKIRDILTVAVGRTLEKVILAQKDAANLGKRDREPCSSLDPDIYRDLD